MAAVHRYRMSQRVEFAETDLAGIVHYSNFFRYIERAEHAFYRSLGFSVAGRGEEDPERQIGWPRIHASLDFKKPLHFEEEFVAELLVEEVADKTIRYRTMLWKQNGELAASGAMGVICIRAEGGKMKATSIPVWVRELIEPAPPSLLAGDGQAPENTP